MVKTGASRPETLALHKTFHILVPGPLVHSSAQIVQMAPSAGTPSTFLPGTSSVARHAATIVHGDTRAA
jgi:hypothetical protein